MDTQKSVCQHIYSSSWDMGDTFSTFHRDSESGEGRVGGGGREEGTEKETRI